MITLYYELKNQETRVIYISETQGQMQKGIQNCLSCPKLPIP